MIEASVNPLPDAPAKSALLDTLAALDDAFAIVDLRVDPDVQTVTFVTHGFTSILPHTQLNQPWQDALQHEPVVRAVFSQAIVDKGKSQSSDIKLNGKPYRVECKRLPAEQMLVTLRPVQRVTENLHEYMQVRDSLFSTSRTISVSEMATTLAHEINTPIGTISNILRGVKMRLRKPDTSLDVLDDALSRALDQTRFTQNVINRIRDFTQSRRPSHKRLDLRTQVGEAVSLLDWMLGQANCRLDMHLSDAPVHIVGDATMLQQVLINLLRNAVDAMEQQQINNRHISISITTTDETVTVSISDTGVGLGSGTQNLFVPFATNKAGGMGVGLNICRSFVELHQGRLWLSPNETDGCTSFIELPLAEAVTLKAAPQDLVSLEAAKNEEKIDE